MSNEGENGAEIDPYRLEAMRLAVQWTERHAAVKTVTLIQDVAVSIEAYLRTGATS